jgi:hypothetical protein
VQKCFVDSQRNRVHQFFADFVLSVLWSNGSRQHDCAGDVVLVSHAEKQSFEVFDSVCCERGLSLGRFGCGRHVDCGCSVRLVCRD